MSRHSRWMGQALAVMAAGLTVGLLSTAGSAQEIRRDLQELRRDRRDIRQDGREIREDRRELRGDTREVHRDRRELRGDRRELRDAYRSGDPQAVRQARQELAGRSARPPRRRPRPAAGPA